LFPVSFIRRSPISLYGLANRRHEPREFVFQAPSVAAQMSIGTHDAMARNDGSRLSHRLAHRARSARLTDRATSEYVRVVPARNAQFARRAAETRSPLRPWKVEVRIQAREMATIS
jgi:hypothetical protein